jgi:hypothetical protein
MVCAALSRCVATSTRTSLSSTANRSRSSALTTSMKDGGDKVCDIVVKFGREEREFVPLMEGLD